MLDDLINQYPLLQTIQPYFETTQVGTIPLHLAGLVITNDRGENIVGSAASMYDKNDAVRRAYFELVERSAIFGAKDSCTHFDLLDRYGSKVGEVPAIEAFHVSPNPDRCRYALSNGIAAHGTWQAACNSAWAELVERDRTLRSWYGELMLQRVSMKEIPADFHEICTWEARVIPGEITVGIVIGFPNKNDIPLTVGLGTGHNTTSAVDSATKEAIQRLGFLLGESIPDTVPQLSPTPGYHQEFFLHRGSHDLLRAWFNQIGEPIPHAASEEVRFIDLTPPQLRDKLWVAKAMCSTIEPLIFGEPIRHNVQADRLVHPIA